MPKGSEFGELVHAEPEVNRDRAQIAARYDRSLGYRGRVFARVVRGGGQAPDLPGDGSAQAERAGRIWLALRVKT